MSIGVASKIEALVNDCDQALSELPSADERRWAWRIEDQRRLLLNPTLRAVVALSARIVEESPRLKGVVRPVLAELISRHSEFAPYLARVSNPYGAHLTGEESPALPA